MKLRFCHITGLVPSIISIAEDPTAVHGRTRKFKQTRPDLLLPEVVLLDPRFLILDPHKFLSDPPGCALNFLQ